MTGSVCIHGHFYQPPREDPWLEDVPEQAGAAPFHDWNDRIHAECYRPNTAARVLDPRGRIADIIATYSWMSFDFGPTLLRWLQRHHPDTHRAIVAADAAAVARWGRGVAMAQSYNHTILPLDAPHDRRTQIRWGLADFAHRFGRPADAMWLPECAVDTATLEDLAAEGVAFTVLAPRQIEGVRDPGGAWHPTPGGPDPRRPYRVELPSGRSIAVFVYDGPLSQAVAFERLLERGDALYERLRDSAPERGQLANIATDGESYGHHHPHGEMALAWALRRARREGRVLPYGPFLDRHPPAWGALIREATSWSCAHGVERWRSDCGCQTGGKARWNQAWRAPLRAALDRLRDAIDARWEPEAATLLSAPWSARDAYIDVILEPARYPDWLARHAVGPLDGAQAVRARELLELQRHRLLMFTSCAWFFSDLAGIETIQALAHARRAIELAQRIWPDDVSLRSFRADLTRARSNDPREGSGADLLDRQVEPLRFDALRAAAHHAAIRRFVPDARWMAFSFDDLDQRRVVLPDGALVLRRCVVTEEPTGRRTPVLTASLVGPARTWGAARPDDGASLDAALDGLLPAATARVHATWPAVVDGLDRLLPRDRARIAQAGIAELEGHARAMGATWQQVAAALRDPTGGEGRLLRFAAHERALDALRAAVASTDPLPDDLPEQAAELEDPHTLAAAAGRGLGALVAALDADDPDTARALVRRVRLLRQMGALPDLWEAQNAAAALLSDPRTRAPRWELARREVAGALHVAVE